RLPVERTDASAVPGQPEWGRTVLQDTRREIDGMNVLEDAPPGPAPPGLEELAFSVWSHTDLAAFGFSSAIEIQEPSGTVISRFALNLPSLPGPQRPVPAAQGWQ